MTNLTPFAHQPVDIMLKPHQLILAFWLLLIATGATAGPLPTAPKIAAESFLLIDYATQQVLVEQDADKQVEPASLTKLMTAYVVFDEIKQGHIALDDQVLISEKAWRTGGSRTFVEVDTEVSVETLLQGMIIQSGNDASVALAEYVAGSEDSFADYMNRYAEQLGMHGSHFVNSTGLPAGNHFTTARDMGLLARAIIQEFPEHYPWYSQREFTYNNITQHNRNKLLGWDDRVDGMKTGYTVAAGYCLVSSAKQDEMRLISVVMGTAGARDRARESQKLLNYGFRFYETRRLFVAREARTQVPVWMGTQKQLSLGLAEDLYISLPRGDHDKLRATMEINEPISAPVAENQILGTLKLQLPDGSERQQALIALEAIPEGSLFQQLSDSVRLWFN